MINRESNYTLNMQFKPLAIRAGDLLTEVQNKAFEVGYHQGMDDLVTYLQRQGVQMPEEIRGLRASAFSQIIAKGDAL